MRKEKQNKRERSGQATGEVLDVRLEGLQDVLAPRQTVIGATDTEETIDETDTGMTVETEVVTTVIVTEIGTEIQTTIGEFA